MLTLYRKNQLTLLYLWLIPDFKICAKDGMSNLHLLETKPLLCGELVFEMGAEPNKKWGVGKDAVPASMGK